MKKKYDASVEKILCIREGTLPWATSCLEPSGFFLNEKKINIFHLMRIVLFIKLIQWNLPSLT